MRIVAFDPSTAKTGWALSVDGVVEQCGIFKAPNRLKTQAEKVDFMGASVAAALPFLMPDLVVIEECAPTKNTKTLRALVRAEAIVAHYSRLYGADVVLTTGPSASRSIVFEEPKVGKVTAYFKIKAAYPQFDWPENDEAPGREGEKGGNDMSDAIVMALAGPQLANRR